MRLHPDKEFSERHTSVEDRRAVGAVLDEDADIDRPGDDPVRLFACAAVRASPSASTVMNPVIRRIR